MAGLFTNLAGQVLGAAPEVGPLLPPRFAPWPGIPPAEVVPRPQAQAEAPPRGDAALFPPPLIDPDGPAVDVPLPTLRQMGELGSSPGPPVEPGPAAPAQDMPETTDLEPCEGQPAEAMPAHPAVEDAPPGAPPAQLAEVPSAAGPVIARERQRPPVLSTATGKQSPLDQEEAASPPPAGATQDLVIANAEKDPSAAEPVIARERQRPPVLSTATGKQSPLDQEEAASPPPAGATQDLVIANAGKDPSAAEPVIARERQRAPVLSTATGKQSPADQEEVASPPNDGGLQRQGSDGGASRGGQTRHDHERNIERPDSSAAVVEPVQLVQPRPKPLEAEHVERKPEPAGSQSGLVQARPESGQDKLVQDRGIFSSSSPKPDRSRKTCQVLPIPDKSSGRTLAPVQAQPQPGATKPVEARPEPARAAQPEPVEEGVQQVQAALGPSAEQPVPAEWHAEPFGARPETARAAQHGPVEWQPDPFKGQPEPLVARPEPVRAAQPEPVEAQPEPAKARGADMPVQPPAREPAPAPRTAQPAAPLPAPVVQRQALPAGQAVAPLAPPPVPSAEPDLPASTQARATSTLTTSRPDQAPPTGPALPGPPELAIVPAPEPGQGEMRSATRADAARPRLGEPESLPTVRVTIGSVEVRTEPRPSAPVSPRPRPARQTLSLDDYLKTGPGGRP